MLLTRMASALVRRRQASPIYESADETGPADSAGSCGSSPSWYHGELADPDRAPRRPAGQTVNRTINFGRRPAHRRRLSDLTLCRADTDWPGVLRSQR